MTTLGERTHPQLPSGTPTRSPSSPQPPSTPPIALSTAALAMASASAHALQQFRYVTTFSNPLPWPHVRHVSVPELRHEAPNLPLMANLISALSDCNVSLTEIREHQDTDILQLFHVLQACLQFSLWSQNILKEKVLELQSTQAAKGVSARQLEILEKRYHEMEQEIAAMRKERDALSLSTANLRTSLLQMETTIKLQERHLRQERGRNAQLVAKLDRALCTHAPTAPLMSAPQLSPPRGSRRSPVRDRRARETAQRIKKVVAAFHHSERPTYDAGAQRDGSISLASDTSYGDSYVSAEVAARAHSHVPRPCDSLHPPPSSSLDWRTLVRYIIHEEQKTPPWASTNVSHPTAGASADERRIMGERESMPAMPRTSEPAAGLVPASTQLVSKEHLQAFFAELAAGVSTEVAAYSRAVVARTEEIVRVITQQRMQESAETQQLSMAEVQAARGSLAAEHSAHKQLVNGKIPLPGMRTAPASVATSAAPAPQAEPAPSSPVPTSSTVKNLAPAAASASSHSPSDGLVPTMDSPPRNDSKPFSTTPQASVSPLPPSIASLPAGLCFDSLTSNSPQHCSAAGFNVLDSYSKAHRPLPNFSPDILRTPPVSEHDGSPAPSDAGSDSPRSVVSRPVDEDERDVDVDLLPLDNSSTISPPDSYQSSHDKAYGAAEVGHTCPRMLTQPSSGPPVCPNKAPTAAADVVPPAVSPHASPHCALTSHLSMRSDVSEGSSYGSSQMLRETRAQLQALLEEERACGRAEAHK